MRKNKTIQIWKLCNGSSDCFLWRLPPADNLLFFRLRLLFFQVSGAFFVVSAKF